MEDYEIHDLGVVDSSTPSSTTIRRIELKLRCVRYLGGKCEGCGYDRCREALEFHHRSPHSKDFTISSAWVNRSWDRVAEELDKCILVCANCHREIHYNVRLVDDLGYLV